MPPVLVPRDARWPATPVVVVSAHDTAGFAFTERTHAVDVSGSGLLFESNRELPVGTRVSLRVLIPRPWRPRFKGRAVYSVLGVSRRCERSGRYGRFRVAVRFTGEDTAR